MSNTVKLIIAYTLGQITQLVIQAMCISMSMWDSRRTVFSIAAGFVILFALIAGAWIARDKDDKEPKHAKTYLDYAEPLIEDDTPTLTPHKVVKK